MKNFNILQVHWKIRLLRRGWQRIWVYKTFKTEIKKGRRNNSDFLQSWFSQEISSPLFNFSKFQKCDKSTPESCTMHWNLMNQFRPTKFLKLKYRRGDEIIQTFCKVGSPEKLVPPSSISPNFKSATKVLQNHAQYIEI